MHAESRKWGTHLRDAAPMIATKSVRVRAGLLCLLLWPAHAVAQEADWKCHLRAGVTADLQGNYADAVK